MKLNQNQLKRLAAEAIATAKSACIMVSTFDRASLVVKDKSVGTSQASLVVTQLDIAVEEHIKHQLKAVSEAFDIAWLAEESAQMTELELHDRFHKDYFWCVDPLDGTLPFIEDNYGYSISISLVSKDGTALIGVVANPVTMDIYHAVSGIGAFRNSDPLKQPLLTLTRSLTENRDRREGKQF